MYYYPVIYPYAYPTWGYHPYDERYFMGYQPFYPNLSVEENEDLSDEMRQQDPGNRPHVIDIEEATERNRNFRRVIWTGRHLQVVLMRIGRRESIGLEMHPNTDQFIKIEDGVGIVEMGRNRNNLTFRRRIEDEDAIMIPAGMWHNIRNTGNEPLKLYTIYAPPHHPQGAVHRVTEEDNS